MRSDAPRLLHRRVQLLRRRTRACRRCTRRRPGRCTDCRLFELPAAELGQAFREWYPMAAHLLEGLATQGMEHPRHDRAPRAAGRPRLGDRRPDPRAEQPGRRRGARQRRDCARCWPRCATSSACSFSSQLPGEKLEAVADLAAGALASRRDAPTLSPIEASDREDEVADWLTRPRDRRATGTSLRRWSPPASASTGSRSSSR